MILLHSVLDSVYLYFREIKFAKMLSNCCCCLQLRTGSIILAVLGLLGVIFTLVNSGGRWFYILLGIYFLIPYAALLFGAIKYNKRAVLVYLVCATIFPIIDIVFGIVAIVSIETIAAEELASNCASVRRELHQLDMTCEEFKSLTVSMAAGFYFVGSLIEIYLWLCIGSFYKDLKEENPKELKERNPNPA